MLITLRAKRMSCVGRDGRILMLCEIDPVLKSAFGVISEATNVVDSIYQPLASMAVMPSTSRSESK
jgi:hypothetical protein